MSNYNPAQMNPNYPAKPYLHVARKYWESKETNKLPQDYKNTLYNTYLYEYMTHTDKFFPDGSNMSHLNSTEVIEQHTLYVLLLSAIHYEI